MIVPLEKFASRSLITLPWGERICQLLSTVIDKADAGSLLKQVVSLDGNKLVILGNTFNLDTYHHIYQVGIGKAVVPMAQALLELLGDRIISGFLITKHGYANNAESLLKQKIKVVTASHPIPVHRNLRVTNDLLAQVQAPRIDDLIICLISGGGSSLMVKPPPTITLKDLQETTQILLSCGAPINEINTIRKHLDQVKAGGLSRAFYPATVISLILSDVIGDQLDMIASGLTVPDPSTYEDAWSVLVKYQLMDRVPICVRMHLEQGVAGIIPETLKPGDPILDKSHNFLVGNNSNIVSAAIQAANDQEFIARSLPFPLIGEARLLGKTIVDHVKSLPANQRINRQVNCFIAGGETTVTMNGLGKGGRNQELALGAVQSLAGEHQQVLISLATDGGDGPTDAAGAIATHQTLSEGLSLGLDPADFLARNDSYHYFDQLGDLIKIGPTQTNVNDLVFVFS